VPQLVKGNVVQLPQAVEVNVKDMNLGAQPNGHFWGIDTDRSTTNNHHSRRTYTGNAAEQNPLTQRVSNGSTTVRIANRIVRHSGSVRLKQSVGQFRQRRRMQIEKMNWSLSQGRVFLRNGSLMLITMSLCS